MNMSGKSMTAVLGLVLAPLLFHSSEVKAQCNSSLFTDTTTYSASWTVAAKSCNDSVTGYSSSCDLATKMDHEGDLTFGYATVAFYSSANGDHGYYFGEELLCPGNNWVSDGWNYETTSYYPNSLEVECTGAATLSQAYLYLPG